MSINTECRNKNMVDFELVEYVTNNIFSLKPYGFLVVAITKQNLIPPSEVVEIFFFLLLNAYILLLFLCEIDGHP